MSFDMGIGILMWCVAVSVTCWNMLYSGRLVDKIKSKIQDDGEKQK